MVNAAMALAKIYGLDAGPKQENDHPISIIIDRPEGLDCECDSSG